MFKVFIDGKAGTTGLRIYERLSGREDITLLTLSEEKRKDIDARREMLNSCDIAFLCLPDDAARESVSLIDNPNTVVLDTSTAHRTDENWAYGFAELSPFHREKIKNSKRIAVPGCHASGFIALVYPLVEKGILPKDALLTCHSLTGFSGGGKKMIEEYNSTDRCSCLNAPRQYGITQSHKHLKEMKAIANIENAPVFSPIVADFYSGMEVTVPLFKSQLNSGYTIEDIKNTYKEKYFGPIVTYNPNMDKDGFISANGLEMKDTMQVAVYGNEDRIILVAQYDNLGKGASGAAVECMNIVIGTDETTGLDI